MLWKCLRRIGLVSTLVYGVRGYSELVAGRGTALASRLQGVGHVQWCIIQAVQKRGREGALTHTHKNVGEEVNVSCRSS